VALLTARQAGAWLGCARTSVLRWLEAGELPARKVHYFRSERFRYLIDEADLEAFAAARRAKNPAWPQRRPPRDRLPAGPVPVPTGRHTWPPYRRPDVLAGTAPGGAGG
jgi:excisionase family DNA binding protein